MKWMRVSLVIWVLIILGCDAGQKAEFVYLFNEFSNVKLYGTSSENEPDPKTVVKSLSTPIPLLATLEKQVSGEQTWFKVSLDKDGVLLSAWADEADVFSDAQAIHYKNKGYGPDLGIRLGLMNRDASGVVNECYYALSEQLLAKELDGQMKRGKYESTKEYDERIKSLKSQDFPEFRLRTTAVINELSTLYNADENLFMIELPREFESEVYVAPSDNSCARQLGYVDFDGRAFDYKTYKLRYFTSVVFKYRSPLLPYLAYTGSEESNLKNDRKVYEIPNISKEKAKHFDSDKYILVTGLKIMSSPEIFEQRRGDWALRACAGDRVEGRIGTYCPFIHKTVYQSQPEYQFIYSRAENAAIAYEISPSYTESRLTRDIKVLLSSFGYEVGKLDSTKNIELEQALMKMNSTGVIKNKSIDFNLLAELLIYKKDKNQNLST